MSKCHFDRGFCSALKVKLCENCKFEKTEAEFTEGLDRAAEILKEKGLAPFEHTEKNGIHIGVRKI